MVSKSDTTMLEPGVFGPDYASPPGETLLDILEEKGMSQAELSERTGLAKKTVNEIIKGKAPITPETAMHLERVLGMPARFWNAREQQYRESLARLSSREQMKSWVPWLDNFPCRELAKRSWIKNTSDPVDRVQEMLSFFRVASPNEWDTVWMEQGKMASFRKSLAFASEPGHLAAWLRYGEIEALENDEYKPFEKERFLLALKEMRKYTSKLPEIFIPIMRQLSAESGVAVVFVPQLPKARVSGATRWLRQDLALLQLSLRYKTNDQIWFSFFHEAAHIILHGKRDVFLESKEDDSERVKENEADIWAANWLIPKRRYEAFVDQGLFSTESIRAFANELSIAPGIVVGRLQHDKHIPFSRLNHLKRKFAWVEEG